MLFPARKEENLLRQSFLNRLKLRILNQDGVVKRKEKVHRRTSDLLDINTRARTWSLPSEAELRKYIGPVDQRLVENAEIAKHRRRSRRYSFQLSLPDLPSRLKTVSLPRYLPPKQTHFSSVRCKWCEPLELPVAPTVVPEHYDGNEETYIDENGIYTTVLCFTEM